MISTKLIIIMLLLLIINAIGTSAYAARLAGVRSKSINSSGTLYNILTLVSRLSNMLLAPLIASIVEEAIKLNQTEGLSLSFRLMILGTSIGVGLSVLLLPFMTDVYYRTIFKLKEHKSIPRLVKNETNIKNFISIIKLFRLPTLKHFKEIKMGTIPTNFLILNVFAYAVYTTGFLAAFYAGSLIPEYRLVAGNLSSAINGFATIALYILIDPVINVISDETIEGKRDEQELKTALGLLAIGRFVGTMLAQALFIPVAYLLVYVAQFFV